eukprot:scaffold7381_cov310-Pinguiococcus_pyrenoidosus.AAC.77
METRVPALSEGFSPSAPTWGQRSRCSSASPGGLSNSRASKTWALRSTCTTSTWMLSKPLESLLLVEEKALLSSRKAAPQHKARSMHSCHS